MELRHLTDEEIQDYLDGNIPEGDKYVQEHLRRCERCRNALQEYKSLYFGLKNDQGFDLAASFPQAVLSKLPKEQTARSRFRYFEFFLIIIGIAVAGYVSLQFINLRPLIQAIPGIQILDFRFISIFLDPFESLLKALNINSSLIIFSALTLVIIKALDYIILHPKEKPLSSLI